MFHNKPLAAEGLRSYRYAGRYGWIMIGATDTAQALCQASRSTDGPLSVDHLEKWNGKEYVPVNPETRKPVKQIEAPKGLAREIWGIGEVISPRDFGGSDGVWVELDVTNGHTSAFALIVWRMSDTDKSPECEARARLIAAAPRLLKELRAMLDDAGDYKTARALIAEIEGETSCAK